MAKQTGFLSTFFSVASSVVSNVASVGSAVTDRGRPSDWVTERRIRQVSRERQNFAMEKALYGTVDPSHVWGVNEEVPPWEQLSDIPVERREECRMRLRGLSSDVGTFLRPPSSLSPSSFSSRSPFVFNLDVVMPTATAALREDPILVRARYRLVPRKVEEEVFWRNYFHHIAIIKEHFAHISEDAKREDVVDPTPPAPTISVERKADADMDMDVHELHRDSDEFVSDFNAPLEEDQDLTGRLLAELGLPGRDDSANHTEAESSSHFTDDALLRELERELDMG